MKFLTVRQPWATCLASGVKTIETRPWSTSYRGPLAIHAGLRFHEPFEDALQRLAFDSGICSPLEAVLLAASRDKSIVPRGAVLSVHDLADCVPIIDADTEPPETGGYVYADPDFVQIHADRDDSAPTYLEAERHLGDYTPGNSALILTNRRRLAVPVPMKGAQGLRDVPADVLALLELANPTEATHAR